MTTVIDRISRDGRGCIRGVSAIAAYVLLGCLSATAVSAADLSAYHGFRIGTDLPTVAGHAQLNASAAKVIHERPALIQELEWRPDRSGSVEGFNAVRVIVFSFYNGQLSRMFVDYDRNKTEGLTADDMIESISAVYGAATRTAQTIATGSLSS